MKKLVHHDIHTLQDESHGLLADVAPEGVPWNQLVSVAVMLYHWGLASDYGNMMPLLHTFRQAHGHHLYEQDGSLMDQLMAQWPISDDRPRIWACYHIGPYGLMTRALLQRRHRVAVLLKDEVYAAQYPVYHRVFAQCFGRPPETTELRFIRSGTPTCMLQLKQAVQDGMHVLCYIDGDEGGETTKGTVAIRMHGVPLRVRYGIAVLAQWTGVPIRPLLLYRDAQRLHLHSDADYTLHDKSEYCTTMQQLFALPESLDARTLMQWETLPGLPARVRWDEPSKMRLPPLWMPLEGGENLLFDLATLSVIRVPPEEHGIIGQRMQELLHSCSDPKNSR